MRPKIDNKLIERVEALSLVLAQVEGQLQAKTELLNVVGDYETVKKELLDAELKMAKREEDHARDMRDIEHKVGLLKIQTEQESKAAKKEAELAVREEGMAAQKEQFEDQMKFREERFKEEQAATRSLLEQILQRLPSYTHQTVRHEGVQPSTLLQIGDGTE